MDFQPPFGAWLKARRRQLDLTQEALGKRANYSAVAIQKVEAGARASQAMARALAAALDIPPADRDVFIAFARGSAVHTRLNHLPTPINPLLGRERALADLSALITRPDVRLVTLIGPPGVGKTRLAIQAAHDLHDQFADGASFVALAPVAQSELIPTATANALQVRELGAEPALETLARYLEPREALLVFDNFRHLLGGAPMIGQLLERCPRVRALVTSRAVLGVSGEHVFEVAPLSDAPAIALFAHHAAAVKPDFALTDANRAVVEGICRALDGLPLAIELAAARSRMLTPGTMLDRLTHRPGARFDLLAAGPRDWPERQRTLRATIDWSHDLPSPDEQRFFRRLAVFAGGCTLESAAAVCIDGGSQADAETQLQSLLDRSLIFETEGLDGGQRFNLLAMIREYAQDKLSAADETDAMHRRLAAYFVQFAEANNPYVQTGHQLEWLRRVASERNNVYAVLAWSRSPAGDYGLGLRLAGGIGLAVSWGSQWKISMPIAEARSWLDDIETRILAVPPERQALVLYGLMDLVQGLGDWRAAYDLHPLMREVARRTGDAYVPWAMNWSEAIEADLNRGDFAGALPYYERIITDAPGYPLGQAFGRALFALTLAVHGRAREAVGLAEQALTAYREAGITWASFGGTSFAMEVLALAHAMCDEFEPAHEFAVRSANEYAAVGWLYGELNAVRLALFAALAAGVNITPD